MSDLLHLDTSKLTASAVVVDRESSGGKMASAFRFTGACVGSLIVAGKPVVVLGAACKSQTVRLCESILSVACSSCGRILPKRRGIPGKTGVKPSPVVRPVHVAGADGRVQNRALVQPARPQTGETVGPPRTPHIARRAGATERKPPRPQEPSPAEEFSDPTPEQVEAADFGSAAQKFLFNKGLSDLKDGDAAVRARAAKALSRIPHALSGRALAAHFFCEPAAQVRKECVNALVSLGVKEGLPVVEQALHDGNVAVRLAGVMAAYRLAGAMGASTLLKMLKDESIEVRRMVACCIGWMEQKELAVELVPLLGDGAVQVRRAAVEAIGNLGDSRAVPSLIECLNDADDSVQRKVLEALERITGKKMHEGYPEDKEERGRLQARWRQWWKR